METKEDKRNNEGKNKQQLVSHTHLKAGLEIDQDVEGIVGFGKKVNQSRGDDYKGDRKGGRKNKPQFKADDFPTL